MVLENMSPYPESRNWAVSWSTPSVAIKRDESHYRYYSQKKFRNKDGSLLGHCVLSGLLSVFVRAYSYCADPDFKCIYYVDIDRRGLNFGYEYEVEI